MCLYCPCLAGRASSVSFADGVVFMPVSTDSQLFQLAATWQFPAFTIALGSSYFQRLLQARRGPCADGQLWFWSPGIRRPRPGLGGAGMHKGHLRLGGAEAFGLGGGGGLGLW